MVASRGVVKQPHSARMPVAIIASWDLEKDDAQVDPTTLSGKADTAGESERIIRPAAAPG